MKYLKNNLPLISIIVIAVAFRFVNLANIPVGFNDDEAAFGYNAYSLIKTGRDEWGGLLPFPVFESFGDWKLVGYLYLTVASEFLFGISEFATRFPSALIGVLAVFSTYLLSKQLFNKSIALLSALLLAISPWHIIASRNAFESDLLVFFITISTYFFLRGLSGKKFFTLAVLGFVLSFYIYRSAWTFIPLFLASLFYLYRKNLKLPKLFIFQTLVIGIVMLLPLVPTVFTFKGQSRFLQESFTFGVQKAGIINQVNSQYSSCQRKLPSFYCRFIYNRYIFYFSHYLNNYFSNLSPETYNVNANPTGYQSAPQRSFFYTFELPLFGAGLLFLILKKHKAINALIIWLLIVPLGPSLTTVGNPGRLNIIMPVPQIIEAFGLISLLSLAKQSLLRMIVITSFIMIIMFSLVRLTADMLYYYPKVSSRFQRYGYKQLFNYLQSQKDSYSQIAVSRRTDDAKQYIHYLFYEKINPSLFFDPNYTFRYRGEDGWQVVERIGNFEFYPSTPGTNNLPPKSLLAVGEKEVSFPSKPIFTVDDLNGDRLFEVYDIDQVKASINFRGL